MIVALKNFQHYLIWLLAASLLVFPRLADSCMSCFHSGGIPQKHNQGHAINAASSRTIDLYGVNGRTNSIAVTATAVRKFSEICKKRCFELRKFICTSPHFEKSLRVSISTVLVTGGVIALAHHHAPATMKRKIHGGFFKNELIDGQDDSTIQNDDSQSEDETGSATKEEVPVPSSAMIATIGIYKNFISPLLPPACRFVPTCSQYGVQAIKEFGPSKGLLLTSWRILRCTPFGGKGFDPPKWPPVSYTYSSY
eukprot:CAMPEP_0197184790 /NCGR_PEP_ID=MMETSP1423-20130617/10597_1 /TAXON_ID=476441 /ORGANISM="Pseudo-nitzschia heimii, Strain UNC1101" /LENGTH=252 /DNA_ID=CAMNT_0042635695 /DNA_START=87 /DNA_END=845 /DNA_ORIENTATION=+